VKDSFGNNLPIVNLYKKKSLKFGVDTQLLYGDNFEVIKKYSGWKKIRIKKDGYIGYIKNKKFSEPIKPNFKVSVLKARLFSNPSSKKKLKKFLPYESRLKIIKKNGKFGKFGKYWIKISDLKKINFKYRNIFKDIKLFKNTRYLWGGKSYKGIDCSALVQVFFNHNNKYCPRDSKDQEKYFKRIIKLKNIRKNDMIFWKGHVAVALSKNKLIHAYGPMKRVVVMSTKKTIERIYKTANLKVTSIRRI
jgi:cell wall-associated NlpC family hydrolase